MDRANELLVKSYGRFTEIFTDSQVFPEKVKVKSVDLKFCL
jgi:hypothetical protein